MNHSDTMTRESVRILESLAENAAEKSRISELVKEIYTLIVKANGTVKNKSVNISTYASREVRHTYMCKHEGCAYSKVFDATKKGSKNERSFRKHILDHGRPLMCCTECDYKTTGKQQLNQHIRRKHSTCSYKCPHASCSFTDTCSMYGNVQIHYARKHIHDRFKIKTETGNVCGGCRAGFSNSQTFHAHLAKCIGPFMKIGSGGSRKATGMDLRSIFAC